MRGFSCLAMVLMIAAFFLQEAAHGARPEVHSIRLADAALGGTLRVVELLNRNARYVDVRTASGESVESVTRRIASAINDSDPFGWFGPKIYHAGRPGLHAQQAAVGEFPGSPGEYVLAGTEKGLGIPIPPRSLSCSYDPDAKRVLLHWENPPKGYDGIAVIVNGVGGRGHPGTSTSRVVDMKGRDASDMDFCVVGFSGDTPSNAAAIHLSNNAQDELFGIPFTNGIAPNWSGWLHRGNHKDVEFLEGIRPTFVSEGNPYNPIETPSTKPFYQIVKTRSPGVTGGVSRRFLGLTPGHVYRISALLNTLDMDSARGDWSFSLHAAYNEPEGTVLTADQLSGLAQLPDGSKGPEAARIASYEPGLTTKGKWELCSTTDSKLAPDQAITDIKLPPGVDTMTVWVRHRGSESRGVGILWVKLEDLSMVVDRPSK